MLLFLFLFILLPDQLNRHKCMDIILISAFFFSFPNYTESSKKQPVEMMEKNSFNRDSIPLRKISTLKKMFDVFKQFRGSGYMKELYKT